MVSFFKRLAVVCIATLSVFAGPVHQSQVDTHAKRSLNLTLGSLLPNIQLGAIPGLNLGQIDAFNGAGNLIGLLNPRNINIIGNQQCIRSEINVVQQQLAIIQELAKQIVLTQVCEVEVQAIILQSILGNLGDFHQSLLLRRGVGIPGFDNNIAALIGRLINADGTLRRGLDLGFLGRDIGRNLITVDSNWDNNTSPSSVEAALRLAQLSSLASHLSL